MLRGDRSAYEGIDSRELPEVIETVDRALIAGRGGMEKPHRLGPHTDGAVFVVLEPAAGLEPATA